VQGPREGLKLNYCGNLSFHRDSAFRFSITWALHKKSIGTEWIGSTRAFLRRIATVEVSPAFQGRVVKEAILVAVATIETMFKRR
jgi:hypothetical protein